MQKYKYNLLELQPPDNYKWLKQGQEYKLEDRWCEYDNDYTFYSEFCHLNRQICFVNWPVKLNGDLWGGWARLTNEKT